MNYKWSSYASYSGLLSHHIQCEVYPIVPPLSPLPLLLLSDKVVLNPTIETNRVQWNFRHLSQTLWQTECTATVKIFHSTRPPKELLGFSVSTPISRAPVGAKTHLQEEKVSCDLGDYPSVHPRGCRGLRPVCLQQCNIATSSVHQYRHLSHHSHHFHQHHHQYYDSVMSGLWLKIVGCGISCVQLDSNVLCANLHLIMLWTVKTCWRYMGRGCAAPVSETNPDFDMYSPPAPTALLGHS